MFYRMLMEDEECRQIQKAYDEAISAVLDRIQDKWDFRKKYSLQWIEHSIGGAFMHIVILEPEEEWETSLRDNIGGIGHDALKNDNKFRNEKSPCMQRNVCGGDLCSF